MATGKSSLSPSSSVERRILCLGWHRRTNLVSFLSYNRRDRNPEDSPAKFISFLATASGSPLAEEKLSRYRNDSPGEFVAELKGRRLALHPHTEPRNSPRSFEDVRLRLLKGKDTPSPTAVCSKLPLRVDAKAVNRIRSRDHEKIAVFFKSSDRSRMKRVCFLGSKARPERRLTPSRLRVCNIGSDLPPSGSHRNNKSCDLGRTHFRLQMRSTASPGPDVEVDTGLSLLRSSDSPSRRVNWGGKKAGDHYYKNNYTTNAASPHMVDFAHFPLSDLIASSAAAAATTNTEEGDSGKISRWRTHRIARRVTEKNNSVPSQSPDGARNDPDVLVSDHGMKIIDDCNRRLLEMSRILLHPPSYLSSVFVTMKKRSRSALDSCKRTVTLKKKQT